MKHDDCFWIIIRRIVMINQQAHTQRKLDKKNKNAQTMIHQPQQQQLLCWGTMIGLNCAYFLFVCLVLVLFQLVTTRDIGHALVCQLHCVVSHTTKRECRVH